MTDDSVNMYSNRLERPADGSSIQHTRLMMEHEISQKCKETQSTLRLTGLEIEYQEFRSTHGWNRFRVNIRKRSIGILGAVREGMMAPSM